MDAHVYISRSFLAKLLDADDEEHQPISVIQRLRCSVGDLPLISFPYVQPISSDLGSLLQRS